MKKIVKLLPAVLLLFVVALSGCEKDKNPLKSTEWKLYGFGNTADGTLQQAEPTNCDNCYTIMFGEDGKFKGHTSTNAIEGEYRVTKRIQLGKDDDHFTAYSTNQDTYADGRLIHEPFAIPKQAIRRIWLVLGYVVKKNGGTMVYNNR